MGVCFLVRVSLTPLCAHAVQGAILVFAADVNSTLITLRCVHRVIGGVATPA